MLSRRVLLAGLATATAARPETACAGRTVRLVVPAAPGGAIDAVGRIYAERMQVALDETWVVENRAGANNTLGANYVAQAAGNGTTLLVNADIHLMAAHVMKRVPYDPVADFTPISRLATSPLVLIGNPGKTPADLKALAAELIATPDKHTFANSGYGAMGHLASEGIKGRVGAKTTIVGYRGTAPALNDVLGGHTTLMVAPLGTAVQHIQSGALRGFAVMQDKRVPQLPNVPSVAEAGFAGLNYELWYALWAPKGLPANELARINAAAGAAAKESGIVDKLSALGAAPVIESAAEFKRFVETEVVRAGEATKLAGILPQDG